MGGSFQDLERRYAKLSAPSSSRALTSAELRERGLIAWSTLGKRDEGLKDLAAAAAVGDNLARMALAIEADDHLRPDDAWKYASAILRDAAGSTETKDREQAEIARRLAYPAVRTINSSLGDASENGEAFLALVADLDQSRLDARSRNALTGLLAVVHRRRGEDYRADFAAQGCVQDLQVGPVLGYRGALELGLLSPSLARETSFEIDVNAKVGKLSCLVRVWNPNPAAGVRRIRVPFRTTGRTSRLEISSSASMRLFVDGAPALRNDSTDRWDAATSSLALQGAPGVHILELWITLDKTDRSFLLRLSDENGVGLPALAGDQAGQVAWDQPLTVSLDPYWWEAQTVGRSAAASLLASTQVAPLGAWFNLREAIDNGDPEAMSRYGKELRALLDQRRSFAEGAWVLARSEFELPANSGSVGAAKEQAVIERAIRMDETHERALIRSLELSLDRGDSSAAAERLAELPPGRLSSVEGALLSARIHLSRGNQVLAERVVEEVALRHPESCSVTATRLDIATALKQTAHAKKLVEALERCASAEVARAEAWASLGDYKRATQLLDAWLARMPDDLEGIDDLADVSRRAGDLERADQALKTLLEYAPSRTAAHVGRADLMVESGDLDGARQALLAALIREPEVDRAHQIAASLGIQDDLLDHRVDGLVRVAEYNKSGMAEADAGAAAVLVFDYDVARVYENGAQRHLIHQIFHLRSKEAIDRYGEIRAASGGSLLTLRSIKPDGSVVEPEEIEGKDALSLRDLEIGDFVEIEYIRGAPATHEMPGFVDLSRFRFQDFEAPYHHSELRVVYPRSVPLRYERRNGAPVAEKSEHGDLLELRFLAQRMPRRNAEPDMQADADVLPMVHVYTQPRVEDYVLGLANTVRDSLRADQELRDLAKKLAGRGGQPIDAAVKQWRWVVENIEGGGGLDVPITTTLQQRRGNGLLLLAAMTHAVGLRTELWLARDKFSGIAYRGGFPALEQYDQPLLAVFPPGAKVPLLMSTLSQVMPPGYLPPALAESDALAVPLYEDSGPARVVRMPKSRETLRDARNYELVVDLEADGSATIFGQLTLQGLEAVLWRNALIQVEPDRIEEVFTQAELGQLFPGAVVELDTLDILDRSQLELPLTILFTAHGQGFSVSDGEQWSMASSVAPTNLATRHARLPQRETGLRINYSAPIIATLTINLQKGSFASVPRDVVFENDFGIYVRKTEEGGVGASTLRMTSGCEIKPGVISPTEYAELVSFALDIQRTESEPLRMSEQAPTAAAGPEADTEGRGKGKKGKSKRARTAGKKGAAVGP